MKKIQVQLILEMLGRPPSHITEALNVLTQKMGNEKGIKILEKKIHEPVPLKDTKDLFTAFAEITAELDSIANYFGLIFAYFPANIEIMSPEELTLSNTNLNELGNNLLIRLHEYDAIAKKLVTENEILVNKLKEVAPYLFIPKQDNSQQQQSSPQQNPSQAQPQQSEQKKAKAKKSLSKKPKKKAK